MVDHQDYTFRNTLLSSDGLKTFTEVVMDQSTTRIAVFYKCDSEVILFPVIKFQSQETTIIEETTSKDSIAVQNNTSVTSNNLDRTSEIQNYKENNDDELLTLKDDFFLCEVCSEVISTLDNLKIHISNHVIPISVDKEPSEIRSAQEEEETIISNNDHYTCDKCHGTFYRKYRYQLHVKFAHKNNSLYPCSICGQIFNTTGSLNNHRRFHLVRKCNICGSSFTTKAQLNEHMQKHPNIKYYTCNVCGEKFQYLFKLRNHEKLHNKDQTYTCFLCNKTFIDFTELQSHRCILVCGYCSKLFSDTASLNLHMEKCEGKVLTCKKCSVSFDSENELKVHLLSHPVDEINYCKICKKVFVDSYKLTLHMLSHQTCEVCGKVVKSSRLKRHMITHTRERPFKCDICEKGFAFKANLKRHIVIHSGEKPYACEICNKAFSDLSSRNVHRKTHFKHKKIA